VTDAQVLERRAGTAAGVPKCSAVIRVVFGPDEPPELMRCPEDAAGLFTVCCACLHIGEEWLCAGHAEAIGEALCRACFEDDGAPHGCPQTAAPVTGRGDGRG
jgi:hypothetical protein